MILSLKTSYIVFIIKNKIVILLCEYILKIKTPMHIYIYIYIYIYINEFLNSNKIKLLFNFFSVKISKTYNFNKNVGSSYLI
jgi:hypothetical protein